MQSRIFALVDCNNFYVSCERVFNPKLKNKPVVVLSNNDGIVIARSPEVKAMGIPMGAPVFKYRDILTENKTTVLSSNFSLYGDMSWRVMETLKTFTDDIEIYSIDEAFLELTDIPITNLDKFGADIKKLVHKWTGIPVSVGIGSTKTLAKVANEIAKKNSTGVFNFINQPSESIEEILENFPIEEIWGVGFRTAPKLYNMGISNSRILKNSDRILMKKLFGVQIERTTLELNGVNCINLTNAPSTKKSIASTRSFGQYITNIEQLNEAVSSYTERAVAKLRSQKSIAGGMIVFIRTNYKSKVQKQYSNSATVIFNNHTNNLREIVKLATQSLTKIYKTGFNYQKAGVVLFDIRPESDKQSDLFEDSSKLQNSENEQVTIEKINYKFGSGKIFLASSGTRKPWKMKSDKQSPKYTSNFGELPIAN